MTGWCAAKREGGVYFFTCRERAPVWQQISRGREKWQGGIPLEVSDGWYERTLRQAA